MKKVINILYQFNNKYAPYAGVSITSLFINNVNSDIIVWILGEDLDEKNLEKLFGTAEKFNQTIKVIDKNIIAELIQKMIKLNMPTYRNSYAANMRMFISDILPDNVERVLYLDGDTIVCRDISDIFTFDIGDNAIAMVQDSLGEKHKSDLGFAHTDKYYNSGVILFDVVRWKELKLTEKIVDHVRSKRAQYPSPDQDLINVVCKKYIHCLGPEYNFQPIHKVYTDKQYFRFYGKTEYYGMEELINARSDIRIIHFFRYIGEFPWDANNVHPYTELFDDYLKQSLWSTYKKIPANNNILTKIEKALYKILPRSLFLSIFWFAHYAFYNRANKLSEKNKISKYM